LLSAPAGLPGAPVLRLAVQGVTWLRRRIDRPGLDRLQLHLIAWREALDPASAAWIEEAKRAAADGSTTPLADRRGHRAGGVGTSRPPRHRRAARPG